MTSSCNPLWKDNEVCCVSSKSDGFDIRYVGLEPPLSLLCCRIISCYIGQCFNSMSHGRYNCNYKSVILKHMSKIGISSISRAIALRESHRTDDWLLNIGLGNGLVPSGNKPLHEPMLDQMVSLGHNELMRLDHTGGYHLTQQAICNNIKLIIVWHFYIVFFTYLFYKLHFICCIMSQKGCHT